MSGITNTCFHGSSNRIDYSSIWGDKIMSCRRRIQIDRRDRCNFEISFLLDETHGSTSGPLSFPPNRLAACSVSWKVVLDRRRAPRLLRSGASAAKRAPVSESCVRIRPFSTFQLDIWHGGSGFQGGEAGEGWGRGHSAGETSLDSLDATRQCHQAQLLRSVAMCEATLFIVISDEARA